MAKEKQAASHGKIMFLSFFLKKQKTFSFSQIFVQFGLSCVEARQGNWQSGTALAARSVTTIQPPTHPKGRPVLRVAVVMGVDAAAFVMMWLCVFLYISGVTFGSNFRPNKTSKTWQQEQVQAMFIRRRPCLDSHQKVKSCN